MEDWKIKIAVLWMVFEFCMLTVGVVGPAIPGYAVETPEMILLTVVTLLIPPILAFLSLTLKDSINRWVNIIGGIVFAVLSLTSLAMFPIDGYFASMVLILIVEVVAEALIVWYSWKSKQKA